VFVEVAQLTHSTPTGGIPLDGLHQKGFGLVEFPFVSDFFCSIHQQGIHVALALADRDQGLSFHRIRNVRPFIVNA
jgi:hypothetical protein